MSGSFFGHLVSDISLHSDDLKLLSEYITHVVKAGYFRIHLTYLSSSILKLNTHARAHTLTTNNHRKLRSDTVAGDVTGPGQAHVSGQLRYIEALYENECNW